MAPASAWILWERRVATWLRRGRWVIALAVIAFAVATATRQVRHLQKTTHSFGGTALSDYLEAGRRAFAGDLYNINFSYPPAFAMAMAPLSTVSPAVAAAVWAVLQVAAVAATVAILWQLLTQARGNDPPCAMPALATLLAFAACARFLNNNLVHGNVNSFVLLASAAGARALYRGRDVRAGAWFAMAATIKFLPLFFLGVLFARRAWRALAGMALFLILLNGVLPLVAAGPARTADVSAAFYRKMVEPFVGKSTVGFDPRNLALSASISEHFLEIQPDERFETEIVEFSGLAARAAAEYTDRPALAHGTLAILAQYVTNQKRFESQLRWRVPLLSPRAANLLTKAILAAIALGTLVASHKLASGGERRRLPVLLESALAMTCLLLVSPKTWTAHYAWLLPALLALAWLAFADGRARFLRAAALGGALLLALSSRGVIGTPAAELVRSLSLETAAVLLFWCLLMAAAWRPAPASTVHSGQIK
jgi:hypothetical protein